MKNSSSRVPKEVEDWLLAQGAGRVSTSQAVSGGCISSGRILSTGNGWSFFLKTNPDVPEDFFQREAEGLAELAIPAGARVPKFLLVGRDFILLEDLKIGPSGEGYWESLGFGLAKIHDYTAKDFGFRTDNYIGSTPQPNRRTEDGYQLFAGQRLGYQAKLAFDRGLLEIRHLRQVEQLNNRLPDLVPEQPASLTHGDLWSGNVVSDGQGSPALIDPAVYYGWAESDLAMTSLFGQFPARFYDAYIEARPLAPGFRDRFPIYNLYHLLNHLNLFGPNYLNQVERILAHFS